MNNTTMENNFKYDIAFSLCKEDADYVHKLVDALNPNLNVFFYETKQEELITKFGFEEFRRIFKEEARLVVVVYRDSWGKSKYTKVERDVIIERLDLESSDFIMMVPFEKHNLPDWYPSSRIYANPFNFEVEQIAKFIEFKVADLGAEVNPVTFEDSFQYLIKKLEDKNKHAKLLQNTETFEIAENEISKLSQSFNDKLEFVKNLEHYFSCSPQRIADCGQERNGSFSVIDLNVKLKLSIQELNIPQKNRSSQYYNVKFQIVNHIDDGNPQIKSEQNYKFNTHDQEINGWSEMHPKQFDEIRRHHDSYLFRDGRELYDLKKFHSSKDLVDIWFKKLFEITKKEYDYLIKH